MLKLCTNCFDFFAYVSIFCNNATNCVGFFYFVYKKVLYVSHLRMPSMLGLTIIAAQKVFVKANAKAGHLLVISSHFVRNLFASGVMGSFPESFFPSFGVSVFFFFSCCVLFACDFTMKAITLVDLTCFFAYAYSMRVLFSKCLCV